MPTKVAKKKHFSNPKSLAWGCVTFVHKRTLLADSYECRCPRRSHWTRTRKGKTTACRKVMSWSSEEERLHALHVLKAWVVRGLNVTVKTRARHGKVFNEVIKEELPSLSDLEAQKPPENRELSDVEDVGAAAKPKTKPKTAKKKLVLSSSSSSTSDIDSSSSSYSSSSSSS